MENVRFIVKYDEAPWDSLDYLKQWDTPEKYAEAPVMIPTGNGDERRELSFEEYEQSFGNPNNYTVYLVMKESRCGCCGQWHVTDVLGGCYEYHGPYDDRTGKRLIYGAYDFEELPGWVQDHFAE